MNAEVNILLSTYNGALYLSEQLDSLLAQDYENIIISIRDDGSTDETGNILRRYSSNSSIINLDIGSHKGIVPSYFSLLKKSKNDCNYYAFCDQDDVWYDKKISNAVNKLESISRGIPAIYFSRLEYVSKDLAHLAFSKAPTRPLSFGNAIVENMATGCTVVMNNTARNIIVENLPGWCVMHDWWSYLVVSALGVAIYDEEPQIKYRLHGANQAGASYLLKHRIIGRIKRFVDKGAEAYQVHSQAQELMNKIGSRIPKQNRDTLKRFIVSKNETFIGRTRLAFGGEIYRQDRVDDILLRILLLAGRY